MVANDTNQTCETCFHFIPNPNEGGSEGVCVRYPPQVFPFPVQSVIGSEPQILLRMFRAGVRRQDRCGEYKHSFKR